MLREPTGWKPVLQPLSHSNVLDHTLCCGRERSAEHPIDGAHEHRGIDRFAEEETFAALHRMMGAFAGTDEGGDEELRPAAQRGLGIDLRSHVAAIFSGHIDIEQDHVRHEGARGLQRVAGAVDFAHLVAAGLFQKEPDEARKVRIIVHHENFCFGVHEAELSDSPVCKSSRGALSQRGSVYFRAARS